jgi:hypothetical protein
MIYGALIGLGFNIVETSVYIMMVYAQTGTPPYLTQLIGRYTFLGFDGHALYTALTGAGIGLAVQARRPWVRIAAPLGFFALAVGAHTLWDIFPDLIPIVTEEVNTPAIEQKPVADALDLNPSFTGVMEAWLRQILLHVVLEGFYGTIFIILLIIGGRWEWRVMHEELAEEVDSPVVTQDEYATISARRMPRWKYPDRKIFNCQAELAMRKWHLKKDGKDSLSDPLAAAWRADITRLRAT